MNLNKLCFKNILMIGNVLICCQIEINIPEKNIKVLF
jgi:hypothetical protein